MMKTASQTLNESQRQSIEQAIKTAEERTGAEIVVVVATRSGRYDRAEDLFGLVLALLGVTAAWVAFQDLNPSSREWVAGNELTLGLLPVLVLFVVWWLVGVALATRFPALASPFISRVHYEAEVRRRGFEAFHTFRLGATKGRTGVLIYVSLLEHMAWVSGDEAVNAVVPPSAWNDAIRVITDASRRGALDKGLVEAVALVGAAVSEKVPKTPDDTDELPNTVYLLD